LRIMLSVNRTGFIEKPVPQVKRGGLTEEDGISRAMKRGALHIEQGNAEMDSKHKFVYGHDIVARRGGELVM